MSDRIVIDDPRWPYEDDGKFYDPFGREKISPPRILCSATVEMLRFGQEPLFAVEVTGIEPHGWRRVYEISARSDTLAAQEGIRLFVEEAEILAGIG